MSLDFNGVNDLLQMPSSTLGQSVSRMSCFIRLMKRTATGARLVFISTGVSSLASRFSIEYGASQFIRPGGRVLDGDSFVSVSSVTLYPEGIFYNLFVEVDYAANTVIIRGYDDSGLIASETLSIGFTAATVTSNTQPSLSRIGANGTGGQPFDGIIEQLSLYQDANFSNNEVDAMVVGGKGWDLGTRRNQNVFDLRLNEAPDGNTSSTPVDYSFNNFVVEKNGSPIYRGQTHTKFNRRRANG